MMLRSLTAISEFFMSRARFVLNPADSMTYSKFVCNSTKSGNRGSCIGVLALGSLLQIGTMESSGIAQIGLSP